MLNISRDRMKMFTTNNLVTLRFKTSDILTGGENWWGGGISFHCHQKMVSVQLIKTNNYGPRSERLADASRTSIHRDSMLALTSFSRTC